MTKVSERGFVPAVARRAATMSRVSAPTTTSSQAANLIHRRGLAGSAGTNPLSLTFVILDLVC